MKPIYVGLLGVGTVGGGTYTVLKRNQQEITRRTGRNIVIRMIADLDQEKVRRLTAGDDVIVTSDALEVARHPEIDIVIELMGGQTMAKQAILEAIPHGK
ncbi:MAG: homoserine dehydrogenase, partial [Nitrosomonas sp.]|nr:homoserine dehydrogenase [Nitrosomonas sp.]